MMQVQQQLAAVSAIILSRLSPKGAGALAFGLSQGRLVLLGAQMGAWRHACIVAPGWLHDAPQQQHDAHAATSSSPVQACPNNPATVPWLLVQARLCRSTL